MSARARAITGSTLALIATTAAASAALGGGWAPAAEARRAAPAPLVRQLVVPERGRASERSVRAARTRVRVSGRACAVGAGTPLAALLRSRVDRTPGLTDYGACSPRARDAGSLYVSELGGEAGAGQDGWVYKVGPRLATAGAGDPAGPFGRGLLRRDDRLTWFYCRHTRRGCQLTLEFALARAPDGAVEARVVSRDDRGRARPAAGARVVGSGPDVLTGPGGSARIELPSGSHTLHAEAAGRVRSFSASMAVP